MMLPGNATLLLFGSRTLQRRGCVHALRAAGYELASVLLGPEEEESLPVRVPMLWDKHGTAEAVRLDVVPVRHPGSSGAVLDGVIVHPGIRVEFLMPVRPLGRAMELLCSVLGDGRDGSARVAPEFGLVIRRQYPQLLNRVHVRLIIVRTVGSGIQDRKS